MLLDFSSVLLLDDGLAKMCAWIPVSSKQMLSLAGSLPRVSQREALLIIVVARVLNSFRRPIFVVFISLMVTTQETNRVGKSCL